MNRAVGEVHSCSRLNGTLKYEEEDDEEGEDVNPSLWPEPSSLSCVEPNMQTRMVPSAVLLKVFAGCTLTNENYVKALYINEAESTTILVERAHHTNQPAYIPHNGQVQLQFASQQLV